MRCMSSILEYCGQGGAADMIITERNIIGNLVGTWTELTEVLLRT